MTEFAQDLFQLLQVSQNGLEIDITHDAEADDLTGETVPGACDHGSELVVERLHNCAAFQAIGHTEHNHGIRSQSAAGKIREPHCRPTGAKGCGKPSMTLQNGE